MRRALCAALPVLFTLCIGGAASGQEKQLEHGVVVELFTSQGCSSCPPADEYLARLADRPGIIALALHVDYWDYIGWKDRFAKPKFTDRQKAYAVAEGSRSIYTPQMIIDGTYRIEGLRPMEVADVIQNQRQANTPAPVSFALRRAGSMLEIVISADPPLDGDVDVHLVRYLDSETQQIDAGENAGRTVTYRNIVTEWDTLGSWGGSGTVMFHVRNEGDEPTVVIVQKNGPGAILAAVRAR